MSGSRGLSDSAFECLKKTRQVRESATPRVGNSPTRQVGESSTYAKTPENLPHCHVPFIDTIFRIAVIDTFSRMDGDCVASSVKLLYFGILYHFIAGKNILSRNLCRFLSKEFKIGADRFIDAGNLFSVFSIASSVKKILPNKIVSLYLIFFSKIVYWYRFNQYIFEYRCPPLQPMSCKRSSFF
jgi:hypothetical protein